jgi:peptidoglycan-associated lipoprotein
MIRLSALLCVGLLLPACGRKRTVATLAPPAAETSAQAAPTTTRDDSGARAAEAARLRAVLARLRATLEEMVFFDYDRSEIRADLRRMLDAKVTILNQRPEIRLRFEGHADERGSAEYNLALGLRRAESVRTYLSNFGINSARLEVATYGEERPLSAGSSEELLARNRRAEFRILGGLAGGN